MSETFQEIPISNIHPNEADNRSMDSMEIADLSDSIERIGLVSPLVVYRKTNNFYTLLSGQKRLKALQQLGKQSAMCKIVDPPTDSYSEQEYLAQANMHRSSPEDLKHEIELMQRSWDTMDDARRNQIVSRIEQRWVRDNQDNPRYQADPAAFKRSNFRPKLIYIGSMTGLGLGNTTIKKYLKQISTAENDPDSVTVSEAASEPERAERPVTYKTLEKAAKNLLGKIRQVEPANHEVDSAFADMESQLEEFIEFVKQFSE